jgi:hypothetical protein
MLKEMPFLSFLSNDREEEIMQTGRTRIEPGRCHGIINAGVEPAAQISASRGYAGLAGEKLRPCFDMVANQLPP